MLTHKELKSRALERANVRAEYDRLGDEFAFLDEFLKARSAAGMSQAELAECMGTTQSVIARLESGHGKHSPSLATLRKYAHALGCRIDLRLVKEPKSTKTRGRTTHSS
ncbi:MAG: transcriptional regulator [Syntrophus sp. (in: bacteria)]|nr:transcriptional regulator [Syntrophus sp. (in: bacteria)]